MTIYPKLNARGEPSGSFIVEVTRRGVRTRRTVRGLQEAQGLEAELLAGYVPPVTQKPPAASPESPTAYTVGDLAKHARVIWKGTKSEAQSVQRFEDVCELIGHERALSTVRTAALDEVVSKLEARGLSPATVHRYLAAFSAALRWAVTRDHIAGMPTIPWPKQGIAKVKDPVSLADEQAIMARLHKSGSPDVALIADVLLATGARVGEVLGVDPNDIDVEAEQITFRDTKNGRDRQVPLEAALCRRYWALATVGMPSYRRVSLSLHRARAQAGVKQPVTPHVLRHTVATRLSGLNVSIPTIGKLLGHRNVRTTEGYIHPEQATVREAASHLKRGAIAPSRGNLGSNTGKTTGKASGAERWQPIEKMEASPGIEPGLKDLQCAGPEVEPTELQGECPKLMPIDAQSGSD